MRVWHHDGVVFCPHHALHAFAILAGTVVDMRADPSRSDKRHRFNLCMITQRIDHLLTAMQHVQYTGWNTCL